MTQGSNFLHSIDRQTSLIMENIHETTKNIHGSSLFRYTSILFLLNVFALSMQLIKSVQTGSFDDISISMWVIFVFLQGMACILAVQAKNFWAMLSYIVSMFISSSIIYLSLFS